MRWRSVPNAQILFELDPAEAGGVGFREPGAYVSPSNGLNLNAQSAPRLSLTSDLNKANVILEELYFWPAENFNGSVTLTVTVNDSGATGTGGSLLDSSVIELFVTPVNDPPSIVVPRVQRRSGGRGSLRIPGIEIDDIDNMSEDRVTVSIVAEEGSMYWESSPNDTASTVLADKSTASTAAGNIVTGLLADVRRALSNIWFVLPHEGWEGWTVITFSAMNDHGATTSAETVVVISDPNIEPIITAANTTFIVDQDVSSPLVGLNVVDLVADSAALSSSSGPLFSVTVTTDLGGVGLKPIPPGLSPVPGSETATNALPEIMAGRGLAGVFGTPRSTLSFQGTLPMVNTALEALLYLSANGIAGLGEHSVIVDVKRRGKLEDYSARHELTVDVRHVNQPPQVLWNAITDNPEISDIHGLSLRGLSVFDSDLADGGLLNLRLQVLTEGYNLMIRSTDGITFSEPFTVGIPSTLVEFRGNTSSIAETLSKVALVLETPGKPRSLTPTLRVTAADDEGGEGSLIISVSASPVNHPPEVRIQRPAMALEENGELNRVGENAGVEIYDADVENSSHGYVEVNVSTSHRTVLEVQNITTSATAIHPVQSVTTTSVYSNHSTIGGSYILVLDTTGMCNDCELEKTSPIWHDAAGNEDDVRVGSGSGNEIGESVQAKLQALPSLQALGITVFCQRAPSPDMNGGRKWLVTFLDATSSLPMMRVIGDSLTGNSPSVNVSYAVKGNSVSGSFKLYMAGYETQAIPYNASADNLAAALEAIPPVNAVHVVTPYPANPQGGRRWMVTFFDATGTGGNLPLMKVDGEELKGQGATVEVIEAVRGEGTAELWEVKTSAAHKDMVYVVTMTGALRAKGFFQLGLDYGGKLTWTEEIYPQTVGTINDEEHSWWSFGVTPGNKRGESMEARLLSLENWKDLGSDTQVMVKRIESADGGKVTWAMTFMGAPEDLKVPMIKTERLTGGAIVSADVTASHNRVEGFFFLSYGGITTSPLSHNSLGGDIAIALNSLPSLHSPDLGTGWVAVTRKQGTTLEGGRRWVIAFLSDPELPSRLVASGTSTSGLLGDSASASASQIRQGGTGAILRLVDLGGLTNGLPDFSMGERLTMRGKPSLVTNALASLSYTPRHGWNGQVEIIFRAFESSFNGQAGRGVVNASVKPVNNPPELLWCGQALSLSGALIAGVDEDASIRFVDYDCEDRDTPTVPTAFDHIDLGGPDPGLQVKDIDGWASIVQVTMSTGLCVTVSQYRGLPHSS